MYGPPMGMAPMGGGHDPNAAGKVVAPAVVMMVLTGLGMAWGLFSIVANLAGLAFATGGDQLSQYMSGGIGVVASSLGLAVGAFALYGLNLMRQAKSWSLSLGAVIVSMIPCFGPCWCINLFVGIWALVVLNEASVKGSFQG